MRKQEFSERDAFVPDVKKERKFMSQEEAMAFVNNNAFEFDPLRRRRVNCPDGRNPLMDRKQNPASFFGGTYGEWNLSMTLRNSMARKGDKNFQSLTNTELFGIATDIAGDASDVHYHSDDHADLSHDEDHPLKLPTKDMVRELDGMLQAKDETAFERILAALIKLGCGHENGIVHDPAAYGLTWRDVTDTLEMMVMAENAAQGDRKRLKGEHAEQSVIIYESDFRSLDSNPVSSGRQVFFIQATLHAEWMNDLLLHLEQRGYVSKENVQAAAEQLYALSWTHTNATKAKLAPNHPVYFFRDQLDAKNISVIAPEESILARPDPRVIENLFQ